MLTVYPQSELYEEIKSGNWQEADELEKYREMKVLIENLDIDTYFAAMGASNIYQVRGRLPEEREKLLYQVNRIIDEVDEKELRYYRTHLRHLQ